MLPFYSYSDFPKLEEHKAWAEIDTVALRENYRALCAATGNVTHICVVKADAYGHVSDICAKALYDEGCRFFAVSCIEEALALRKICPSSDTDILVLGYTEPSQAKSLSKNNIIQTLISKDYAELLSLEARKSSCRVRVHVAIDTGMNRIGICARNDGECAEAFNTIKSLLFDKNLITEGLFTHFAQADEEHETHKNAESQTRKQFARFQKLRALLLDDGIKLFSHVCNSAASLRFPEFALDGVRLGIVLYGVSPSRHVKGTTKPVMSFCTKIVHIHSLPKGEKVSYGGNFSSDEDRIIATLPIGYADGFLRCFSTYYVTVKTRSGDFKAKVVGNVCMDQCMIDVTSLPVGVGDKVVIFGECPDDITSLATLANTIEYEILCLVSSRVPRIIKKDKELEK